MKTSPEGLKFIAQEEGTVLHVYKDVRGIPTIGVGHVLREGESYPSGITLEKAMQILSIDVMIAENAVNKGVTVELNQNQYDALVSFVFNCGGGNFASSTLLKLLNQGDYQGAADQLRRWVYAGTKEPNKGLINRRERERALFLKPVPQPEPEPVPVEPEPIPAAPEPPTENPPPPEKVDPPVPSPPPPPPPPTTSRISKALPTAGLVGLLVYVITTIVDCVKHQ